MASCTMAEALPPSTEARKEVADWPWAARAEPVLLLITELLRKLMIAARHHGHRIQKATVQERTKVAIV